MLKASLLGPFHPSCSYTSILSVASEWPGWKEGLIISHLPPSQAQSSRQQGPGCQAVTVQGSSTLLKKGCAWHSVTSSVWFILFPMTRIALFLFPNSACLCLCVTFPSIVCWSSEQMALLFRHPEHIAFCLSYPLHSLPFCYSGFCNPAHSSGEQESSVVLGSRTVQWLALNFGKSSER